MTAGSVSVPQIIPLRYHASGQKKNVVTSNTKIGIKTETKKCNIFYTLNKKKPDPFQKYGERCTYKYKVPFTLAPGNVTIKAIAITRDGTKQSLAVTKVFLVYEGEEMYSLENHTKEESEIQLDTSLSGQFKQRIKSLSRGASPVNVPAQLTPICTSSQTLLSSKDESFTVSTMATPLHQSSPIFIPQHTITKPKPHCLYCLYPRDIKSSAKYCINCGKQLPSLPDKKKEAIRMAVCPSCQTEQPQNTSSDHCLVCDATVIQPPQLPILNNQTETTTDRMESILCLYCGTHNLSHLSHCVTCANPLYTNVNSNDYVTTNNNTTIMHSITGSTYIMCDMCGRVNVSDARYCDWCGCKPMGSDVQLMCQNCNSTNCWKSRYCSNCGFIMKCPLRPEIEQAGSKMRMPVGVTFDHSKWIPIADVDTPVEDKCILVKCDTKSHATQTCGQFYPSAKTITAKKTTEAWQKLTKTLSQDKMAALSSYSSGNGKWRNQVDHLCSYLKAYSNTSTDFQDNINNCQIGKVMECLVKVDNNNNQLLLTVTYTMQDATSNNNNNTTTLSRYISTQANSGRSRSNSVDSSSSYRRRSSNGLSKKPPLRIASTLTIKVEDHLLCAEVGPDGLGREDIVGNLIEKGANVNYIDTVRGLPILLLATTAGHLEAIKVLLEKGVDTTCVSKKTGDTALHEAVRLGQNGKDIISTLLSAGVNPNARNKANLTSCELADKLGHKYLIQCFASHLGSSMLKLVDKTSVDHNSITNNEY